MKWVQKQKGFTIVELLIVVVVIAILAAITIVAYNGIQNRAKASAAQSATSQAGKKITTYAVLNADQYPTQANFVTATGLQASGNTSYQYNVSADLKSFCVTVTTSGLSYFSSNQNITPTSGACAGHGVNGVAAITNLVPNPSFEGGTTGWTVSSNISLSHQTTGGLYGNSYYRGTRTSGAAIGMYTAKFNIDANETYTARLSARYVAGQQAFLRFQWFDSAGVSIGSNTDTVGSISSNVNSWQTLTYTYAAPANATSSRLDIVLTTTGGAAAGDVLDLDGVMVVKGSTTGGYADGNTSGWVWNDTANANTASSSTGPPQP